MEPKKERNLIIAGIEDQLDEVEHGLRKAGTPVKRIARVLDYRELPAIVDENEPEALVYLVQTDDPFGEQISRLGQDVHPYLRSFDNVSGLFWTGGAVASQNIKVQGKYVGRYAEYE